MLFRFAFICFFFLASCGLTPAIDEAAAIRLAQIKVLPIAERQGQLLNTALRRELDPKGLQLTPAYELDLSVTTSLSASFNEVSRTYRGRSLMIAAGTLRKLDGQVAWQGTASRASLLALEEQPGLSAAAQAALWADLAAILAQDIKFRLAEALR